MLGFIELIFMEFEMKRWSGKHHQQDFFHTGALCRRVQSQSVAEV